MKKTLIIWGIYAAAYAGFYLYTKHKRKKAGERVIDESEVELVSEEPSEDLVHDEK